MKVLFCPKKEAKKHKFGSVVDFSQLCSQHSSIIILIWTQMKQYLVMDSNYLHINAKFDLNSSWVSIFCPSICVSFSFSKDFCHLDGPFPSVNDSKLWPGNPPSPFVLMPNSTIVVWAPNVTAPACWPPLSALRLLLAREAFSCVKTCQDSGLVCEPAFFTFINNMEAFNG